jgi:hypothetical protein
MANNLLLTLDHSVYISKNSKCGCHGNHTGRVEALNRQKLFPCDPCTDADIQNQVSLKRGTKRFVDYQTYSLFIEKMYCLFNQEAI